MPDFVLYFRPLLDTFGLFRTGGSRWYERTPGLTSRKADIPETIGRHAADGASSFARLDRYISSQIATVPGYMRTLDVQVLAVLGYRQSEAGIAGALFEIGLHHGKSFFLLVTLRRPGEAVLGVDLFEDDELNLGRHSGRATALMDHADRLGIPLRKAELLKMDSTDLASDEVTRRLGPVRLMHIDGGHGYREVAHDLSLAASIIHERGVVVVDDYQNAEWPGVAKATDAFLDASKGGFVPFLVTPGKLYVARKMSAIFYAGMIRGDEALGAATQSSQMVAGTMVTALKWSRLEAVKRRIFGSRAMGAGGTGVVA